MRRHFVYLGAQPRHDDADLRARLDVLEQVPAQVEVAGAEVVVGVQAYHRVEEVAGEGQGVGLDTQRKNLLLQPGGAHAGAVLLGADPQVGGPHLRAELAGQEDRAQGAAAAQVEHAHRGPQVEGFGQRLGQPEHVGTHVAFQDQLGRVAGRARELGLGEAGG